MIAASFFVPSDHPLPVILFLDEEEMRRLWPDEPDPVESLTRAVRDRLNFGSGNPYRTLNGDLQRWSYSDRTQPPPWLPLLAVTVLAATRMRSDGTASASAYYLRLAQLLHRPEDFLDQTELQRLLTDGFPSVVVAWERLHEWISLHSNEVGVSTIQSHPRWNRIGYPLSQALIRASDRDRLTSFFEAVGTYRLPTLSDDALLKGLTVWASRPRGFSEAFRHSLHRPEDATPFGRAISALAARWNGLVALEGGRRKLQIRLLIDLDSWSCKRVVRLVEGLDKDSFDLPNGKTVHLARPAYGDYYRSSLDLAQAMSLDVRYRIQGNAATLVQERKHVWALREDLSSGCWVSESRLEPYRAHVLVVHSSLAAEFEDALREVADDGWCRLKQKTLLIPGYAIFTDVILSDESRFELASATLPNIVMVGLRPEPPPVPVLTNGLPVAGILGRNHYLLGGEPNLMLPVGGGSRSVETSLDGVAQKPPLSATGFPIPLHTQRLEEGLHEITADGVTLPFYLHREDPSAGMNSAQYVELGISATATATDSTMVEPEVLVRFAAGATDWLVRPDGSVLQVVAAVPPLWLEERYLPDPYYVRVPGEFSWHVSERDGKFRKPRKLGATQQKKLAPDAASVTFWKRVAALEWTGVDPEWQALATIAPLAAWLAER